jgi:hypothetical protein
MKSGSENKGAADKTSKRKNKNDTMTDKQKTIAQEQTRSELCTHQVRIVIEASMDHGNLHSHRNTRTVV